MTSGEPLRVIFPFVGDRVGGSHLSALSLIETLQGSVIEPVVAVHREGILADHLRSRGFEFVKVPDGPLLGERPTLSGYAAALASSALPLARTLRARCAAVVHTNDLRMHMTWALPARLSRVPQVWHQRTVFPPSRSTRAAARLAATLVCISRTCLESLPASCRNRAEVVWNPVADVPVDRDAARRALRAELGIAGDCLVVLFVGNLQSQKRPDVFVSAAAKIAAELARDVQFAILGEDKGALLPGLRRQAIESGIGARLHSLGYRYPPTPVLAAADLLLAPQVHEGFGRVVVEAMLAGTPVVAADSGGHREILESGQGILVSADDPAAMAAAALKLLRDPVRARALADAARSSTAGRYLPVTHSEHMEAIYCAVASRGGRPSS